MENLAPGFRFYPTEEELISFYLRNKLQGAREDLNRVIPVVNINEFSPWDLPQVSGELCHRDMEQWFFFIPRQESEARGGRPRRLTTTGYWKATGSPSYVYSTNPSIAIGVKRTMVFYTGRAPSGKKTEWKMNEYKAFEAHADHNPPQPELASSSTTTSSTSAHKLKQEFSLCRVYKKSKCLRAFDRRPLGDDVILSNTNRRLNVQAADVHHHHHQGANQDPDSRTNSRNPNLMMERADVSSPESSSSGDHGTQPSGESSGTLPMAVDNEIFWDLEQLNNLWLN